ncbi:lactonase family protein [Streptomyces sp. NPDC058374]|uniref:lactonase family protein n=1 Tax=unclassified Streptomyces TaxID=2593676 RepID=UPI003653E289
MFRPTSKPARAAAKAAAVSLSAVTACAATPAALASAVPAPAGTVARQPAPGEETESGGTAGPHDVVFVQTGAEDGNRIVAYTRTPEGTLREEGSYATGGEGGRLAGAGSDGHQASQGALAYDPEEGILIAANSGNGTVSVFEVDGVRLTLRQVTPSGGGFPAGIAVHDGIAYVLNAGTGGSVQGFTIDGPRLEPIAGSRRELGLSTDRGPLQYARTPGQVGFTDDGSRLIVTTKTNGSLQVFDVDDDGLLSAEPVTNDRSPSAPFAFVTGEDGRLVVADAANTVDTFTLWKDNTVQPADSADTGEMGTGRIARNGATVYVSHSGSDALSAYRVDADGALTAAGRTATGAGPTDLAVSPAGDYLYVQTAETGGLETYRIGPDGGLTRTGTTTVPNAVGGEGIVAP